MSDRGAGGRPRCGAVVAEHRVAGVQRSRCVALLVVGIGVLILTGGIAEAQRRNAPVYRLYNWRGKFATEVRNDFDKRDSDLRSNQELNEWTVSEELSIGADGWLYHPALLRFSADVGAEFNQDFVETSDDGSLSEVDAIQQNFNVNLTLLPDKSYPLTLFGSQVHSEITSPFTPRRTIDTLQYGARLLLRDLAIGSWGFPTRMRYRHLDSSTNGDLGTDRVGDEVGLIVDNKTERLRNRLEYEWVSEESTTGGTARTFERQYARLDQDLTLEHGLFSSNVLATDTAGAFKARALTVSEALRLRHGRSLSSNYGYALNIQDTETSDQTTHRASLGLAHQLYESLNTSMGVSGSQADSNLGTTIQAEGHASVNYTKRIPWGRVGLRFSPSYAYQDEDVEAGLVTVLDERHSVTLALSIELENLRIVPSSIIVSDPVTQALFTEGIDYDVVVDDLRTFLTINPFGNIDPGTTPVLSVRYDFIRDPARVFSTLRMLYGLNLQLFDHWTLDVSYSDSNQTLLEGDETETTLSDEERILAYLTAVFGRYRTRVEYERVESDITPRERYTATQSANFRPARGTSVGVVGGYFHDRLTDTDRTSDVFTLDVDTTSWLPYRILGRWALLARYFDETEQDTVVAGSSLSLTYWYGRIRFQLQERLAWNQVETKVGQEERTTELTNTVFFRIERTF